MGVWITAAPKYADRYFELKKDAVVFAIGDGMFTTSSVLQVKEDREKTRSLYEISYVGKDGKAQKFSFYYEPATSIIRMKSQEKIDWKKDLSGSAVAKAAATIPASMPPQQRPPESANESKKPVTATSEFALAVQPNVSTTRSRDPFVTAIKPPPPPTKAPILPPGKRGILISQAKLEGVATTNKGAMVAVVSGPNGRIYFLYDNDMVFDGRVARITIDSIVFEETITDPDGKQSKREIVKSMRADD